MPKESTDNLIHDLGELIATREAMRIGDDALEEALNKAVRAAGVAVSRTVNRSDPAAFVTARQAVAECRGLIDILKVERERARAVVADSERLSGRSSDILLRIRTVTDDIERRRRTRK